MLYVISLKYKQFGLSRGIWSCGEFDYATLFLKNLQLKHKEFLLNLMTTILRRKQRTEIDLDTSKIVILILKKRMLCSLSLNKFEDEELEALLHKDS